MHHLHLVGGVPEVPSQRTYPFLTSLPGEGITRHLQPVTSTSMRLVAADDSPAPLAKFQAAVRTGKARAGFEGSLADDLLEERNAPADSRP